MIGLEIFSCFELQLPDGDTGEADRVLDYVRCNCPNLQAFSFKYYGSYEDEGLSYIRYEHQKGLTSSDPTHINTLELQHIDYAQTYLDIFSTEFPHIESISLGNYSWGNMFGPTVVDLTRFKKLKRFSYSSFYVDHEDGSYEPERDFILLEFTNGKKAPLSRRSTSRVYEKIYYSMSYCH